MFPGQHFNRNCLPVESYLQAYIFPNYSIAVQDWVRDIIGLGSRSLS